MPETLYRIKQENVTITITSPVAATVENQLRLIMKAVHDATSSGRRRASLHRLFKEVDDVHPETLKALEAAGITVAPGRDEVSKSVYEPAPRDTADVIACW